MADEPSDAWLPGISRGLPPRVVSALDAISRVARALNTTGTLADVADRALDAMRATLELEASVLYLPEPSGRPLLRRFSVRPTASTPTARARVDFDPAAWRLAISGGHPLVFNDPAGWLVANPFQPPASHWLVVPLVTGERLVGAVVAMRTDPIELDPLSAAVLSLVGEQLAAGVANAQLRLELEQAAIERERLRVAAEVHDGLAQDLALAMRELAFLDGSPAPTESSASRERLREAVASAHGVVRDRLVDLFAPVQLGGLGPAVEDVCGRFARRGLPVRLACEPGSADVAPEVIAAIVRVLNEALANASKHARASSVDVRLTIEHDAVGVVIADDGRGFIPSASSESADGHLGLGLMRRRAAEAAGELEIDSRPGAGTTITARFPLIAQADAGLDRT